jgi:hypothetical protein
MLFMNTRLVDIAPALDVSSMYETEIPDRRFDMSNDFLYLFRLQGDTSTLCKLEMVF